MADSLDTVLSELKELQRSFGESISKELTAQELEQVRIRFLGRKEGLVSQYFRKMSALPAEDRPALGDALNRLKADIQEAVERKRAALAERSGKHEEFIDLTLPGTVPDFGYQNPLMKTLEEIKEIFVGMGFSIETGPLVESDYYNFEALNIPKDHPSRDLQDTFYLEDGMVLRTHTSPVQIRTMEKGPPPVRIIAPGRCFRKDTPDATHSPEFHQVEGLVVDRGITFAHLKGTLLAFARQLFGPDIQVRFRPSFFPFTEPSAEYDFSCVICGGKGCRVCKNSGWLEISGCGMVDPAVFGYVGYDSEEFTGFAWGMG
ncbi:MAG: phenylalanine--tRNA ligase subunit alpha, partial [Calditrichaeota bacterium]